MFRAYDRLIHHLYFSLEVFGGMKQMNVKNVNVLVAKQFVLEFVP